MVRPDGARAVPVAEFLRRGESLYEASNHPHIGDASRDALREEGSADFRRANVQLECAVEVLEEVVDRNIVGPHVRRELTLALEMLSYGWEDGERSDG